MEHAQEFSEECVGDDGSGDGGMERRSNPRLAQYHFLHTIWVGNQSTVRSAKYKPTGDIFAVKTYTHSVTPAAGAAETWMPGGSAENVDILVRRKRRIFAKVGYNPNVVRLIEYFQSGYKSYFVFELAGGGSLQGYLKSHGDKLPEDEARIIICRLFEALVILHQHCIVHRDIKPSNMLIRDPGRCAETVCLADFGSAYISDDDPEVHPKPPVVVPATAPEGSAEGAAAYATASGEALESSGLRTVVGSPFYLSPEIVQGAPYDSKVDVWSAGCVTYQLLFGKTPFQTSKSFKELYDRIAVANFAFPSPSECGFAVSDEAQDFMCQTLQFNPAERLTSVQALAHPWLAPRSVHPGAGAPVTTQ